MTSTDITAQEQQAEAEVAFSIEKRIKDAIADGRAALWALAEALYDFDEAHGWLKLGHENLSQWLADADVTITRATYYRYVRTWRKLVVEKGIDADRVRQLDQSKVAIVADKISTNAVLVEDALSDVESLGAQDLREKYYDRPASNDGQDESPDESAALDGTEGHTDAEPVRADEVVVVDSELDDALLVQVGDIEVYELPGWVTPGSVQGLLGDLSTAVDSGASFPRVSRSHCQIAQQLAQAWLTTQGS